MQNDQTLLMEEEQSPVNESPVLMEEQSPVNESPVLMEEEQSQMNEGPAIIKEEQRTYAGFFVRLTAWLLDRLILCLPLLGIRAVLWLFLQQAFFPGMNQDVFFRFSPTDIILYVCTVIYFIISTYTWGKTIGKRIMKIQVVSAEDRKPTLFEIFFRETFGRFLSSALLCIGYLIIVAGDQKQALHDYLADTRVVYDIHQV